VLSVAATWVVLGLQGVLQFEILRKRASGDRKSDKFHDGSDVLPHIKLWHDYLRSHIRIADTATARVLDLVEAKMLKKNPADRLTSQDLCKDLDYLLKLAKIALQTELRDSRIKEVDNVVKQALMEVEEKADIRINNTSVELGVAVKADSPTQSSSGRIPSNHLTVALDTYRHQSIRIAKVEKLQKVQYAKTAHRKEILEEELGRRTFSIPGSSDQSTHSENAGTLGEGPEFTESPTEADAPALSSNERPQAPPTRPTPIQPFGRELQYEKASTQSKDVHPVPQVPTLIPPTPPLPKAPAQSRQSPQPYATRLDSPSNLQNNPGNESGFNPKRTFNPGGPNPASDFVTFANPAETRTSTTSGYIPTTISPDDRQLSPLSHSPYEPVQPRPSDAIYGSTQSSRSRPVPTPPQSPQATNQKATPPRPQPIPSLMTPPYEAGNSRSSKLSHAHELPGVPTVVTPASETRYSRVLNPYPSELPGAQSPENASPWRAELSDQSIPHPKLNPYSSHTDQLASDKGKAPAGDVSEEVKLPSPILLPAHVYQLPFHICTIRKILEEQRQKGTWGKQKAQKFKAWLTNKPKGETGKGEFYEMLSTYIFNRDMVSTQILHASSSP